MAELNRAGTPLEARLACPVCLGVQMGKVALHRDGQQLVLDHCGRCGGVWFEKGEAQQLTKHSPDELWKHIPPRASAPRPPCHGCHTPLDRDAAACAVCGKNNELACPLCETRMDRRTHGNLVLDVCAPCRGVWFDHAELKSVWSLAVSDTVAKQPGRGAHAAAMAGDVLLESLFWAPGLVLHAGSAAAQGAGQVIGSLGHVSAAGAAETAMGAMEVVGDAAEGVFTMIMDVIASIFD